MADYQINDLEEQLRQDQRLGKTRRRKRMLRRVVPLVLVLLLLTGLYFLLREPPEETDTETEALSPGSAAATIAFVGDISLDREMIRSFRSAEGYDFSPLFRRVVPTLASADLAVGNLEGNVTDDAAVADHNYPAALLASLYEAGFDVLQTANSYSIQNGITGLTRTKAEIQAAGMDALGTWGTREDRQDHGVLIREVNGLRFAFLAFTKGMNNLRLPEGAEYCVNLLYNDYDTNYTKINRAGIQAAVEEARAQAPDVIVAMVHWGSEYDQEIADTQEEIAKLLLDSGVNVIIGAHSHYVGPMEHGRKELIHISDTFLAYGLGDFVSLADTSSARNGCILTLRFVKDERGLRITEERFTPTYSAEPSERLGTQAYEVLNSLDAISFYESGYYDSVSKELYERLVAAVAKIPELTGLEELKISK